MKTQKRLHFILCLDFIYPGFFLFILIIFLICVDIASRRSSQDEKQVGEDNSAFVLFTVTDVQFKSATLLPARVLRVLSSPGSAGSNNPPSSSPTCY